MTSRKIQVEFSPRELTALAALGSDTIARKVRDALTFYRWCRDAVADGWTIVAVRGETRREPVLPFEARR